VAFAEIAAWAGTPAAIRSPERRGELVLGGSGVLAGVPDEARPRILINEIAWAGTLGSAAGEWIEANPDQAKTWRAGS
jgi:hypothetical protein